MNNAVHGRRLASPVRVSLAPDLGGDLDGAWWPHTASVAQELPELVGALAPRLGQIVDISVNWSALAGSPNLDWAYRPTTQGLVCRQRLMTITGSAALAKLLVVPSRTSSALALMVLRRAADLPVAVADRQSEIFRNADHLVHAARAESARCAVNLS